MLLVWSIEVEFTIWVRKVIARWKKLRKREKSDSIDFKS
jgi:hypothetical protein